MSATYLSVAQVGEVAQRHPKTIEKALRDGRLHGVQQSGKRGTWRIKDSCATAWIEGQKCEHKQKVSAIRGGKTS